MNHEPLVTLAHITDTHLTGDGSLLQGVVDSDGQLKELLRRLEDSAVRVHALVMTGDLAEDGEPGAYRRIKAMVDDAAAHLGAAVVWVPGNHDELGAFHRELLGTTEPAAERRPADQVHDVAGLRVVALDTSVPGRGHGEVTDAQLDWLAGVLAAPAPLGTVVAMHHPPLISQLMVMNSLDLRTLDPLADVLAGSDVRAILSGHLHYATSGSFAGIPVSVSAACSYLADLAAPDAAMRGQDGGQSFNLVHVYARSVVSSVVPVRASPTVYELDVAEQRRIAGQLAGG